MYSRNEAIHDFSYLVANEVEIESANDDNKTTENSQINVEKSLLAFFEASDYLNGAIYDKSNYCWSQTFTEIGKRNSISSERTANDKSYKHEHQYFL